MTQPSSVNQTFDTSLIDVNQSFSSTETNTSGSSAKENTQPTNSEPQRRTPSPFQRVSTDELYTQWARTYDSDGNVLQATDDIQMRKLLPEFSRLTQLNWRPSGDANDSLKLLDLGCGTGRNLLKLVDWPWEAQESQIHLYGWDGGKAMVDIAETKLKLLRHGDAPQPSVNFDIVDFSEVENVPDNYSGFFNGLISTLVLEHLPIDTFLHIVAKLLKPGSPALITNMHPDMGARSQAGYKNAAGERFKGESFIYTVAETVEAAENAGLELLGEVSEIAVSENLMNDMKMGGPFVSMYRAARKAQKWTGVKIWYGMMLRKK